ncbi:MAG: acetyl-CoA carboxylase biotin carboxyl carrier protein [Planctomycetota bacterium]|jgi:acetyl-CoA carboxylase biotin carboxyl carrier protein
MMSHKDNDLSKIKKIIEIMKDNDLVEVEIKHGDDKILLKRSQPQQPAVTAVPLIGHTLNGVQAHAQDVSASEEITGGPNKDDGLVEIKSPIVGTYYSTPSPDSDPFVEVGSHVSDQTVVCIVEAMKVMNEIKADTTGIIAEILVSNGQAVEYGTVLFKVKPE